VSETGGAQNTSPSPWLNVTWLKTTLFLALALAAVTGIISFLVPKSYRAEAKILPNSAPSSTSSLLGLAAASGFGDLVSSSLGSRDVPILTFPEILTSRDLLERVALSPYPPDSSRHSGNVMNAVGIRGSNRNAVDKGTTRLGELIRVDSNLRSGIISVSAVTRDSVLSAYVVQRMLDELDRFNVESRASRERATREFVDGRLKDAQRELSEAEQALARFRETNLRIGNAPQLELEQARLERDVVTRSELYRLLAREFEMARIEEKRDTPTFSVVEPPKPPVRKYRPRIVFNVVVAFLCAVGLRTLTARMKFPTFRG